MSNYPSMSNTFGHMMVLKFCSFSEVKLLNVICKHLMLLPLVNTGSIYVGLKCICTFSAVAFMKII